MHQLASFFEGHLLILEQVDFLLRHVLVCEVANHVRPLQHLATLDDASSAFFEEIQFCGRVILYLVQQLHVFEDLLDLLDANVARF